jgi:hypothetical protein
MEGEGGSGLELGGIFVDDVLCVKERLRGFRGWMGGDGWEGKREEATCDWSGSYESFLGGRDSVFCLIPYGDIHEEH